MNSLHYTVCNYRRQVRHQIRTLRFLSTYYLISYSWLSQSPLGALWCHSSHRLKASEHLQVHERSKHFNVSIVNLAVSLLPYPNCHRFELCRELLALIEANQSHSLIVVYPGHYLERILLSLDYLWEIGEIHPRLKVSRHHPLILWVDSS